MIMIRDFIDVTYSSFLIINVQRHENAIRKGQHPLYRTEAVLDGLQISNVIWLHDSFFIFPSRKDALLSANYWSWWSLFALVLITPGFYPQHVEVVNQDPASDSL